MTNFEKYIDEISSVIAVNKYTKKVSICNNVLCSNCQFGIWDNCNAKKREWMFDEYKEPVTITPQEKALLDMLEDDVEIRRVEQSEVFQTMRGIAVRNNDCYVVLQTTLFKGLDFDWLDCDYHEVREFRNAKVREG